MGEKPTAADERAGAQGGGGGGEQRMTDSFIKMGPLLGAAPGEAGAGGPEAERHFEKWMPALRTDAGQTEGGAQQPGDPVPGIDASRKSDPGRGTRDQ